MLEYQKSAVTFLEISRGISPKSKAVSVGGRNFHSLTYRQSGSIMFVTQKGTLSSGINHVTYMPQGMPYTTTVLEDSSIIALHFKMEKESFFPFPFTEEDKSGTLGILFEDIAKTYSPHNPSNFESYSLFYQILSILEAQIFRKSQQNIHPKIQTARQLIDANFRDNNFNISSIVEILQISDSFLRREFKKAFGVCPVQYLTTTRIQSAKAALLSDYYSVDSIAQQNGFGSSSYFIQVFRKETGLSPLNYKKVIQDDVIGPPHIAPLS